MPDPKLDFSSGGIICAREKMRHTPHVCRVKSQTSELTLYNKCAQANAYTPTRARSQHSQEMAAIRLAGCSRTNFGSEPLLMSRSLMCKSSGPSAKPIRSPHNPAQVQPCSLPHYLSRVPNTVRPLTANKPISKGEKYAQTSNLGGEGGEKKKRKIRKKNKLKNGAGMLWREELCCTSSIFMLYIPFPASIFTPPWKSSTDDKSVLLFCFFFPM